MSNNTIMYYFKRKNSIILSTLLFIIILSLAIVLLGCNSTATADELGLVAPDEETIAPDFTLSTLTNTEVTLSQLQGKPVILNFWHIGCPPCLIEMPYLNAASKDYSDKITILTVNANDSRENITDFFTDTEQYFIVAMDLDKQASSAYGIRFFPVTFFIDSQGVVRYFKLGAFADENNLRESIDKLLEED